MIFIKSPVATGDRIYGNQLKRGVGVVFLVIGSTAIEAYPEKR